GDRWIETVDAANAAREAAALGTRIFLSFGGRELAAFALLPGKWFLVRRIEAPSDKLPLDNYALTLGRGPFMVEDEIDLLRAHRIDVLVTKASGGSATRAKLDAARALNLPVVMIAPPRAQPALTVASAEEAVRRIAAALFPDAAIDGPAAASA
ncbi:MAG TPA: precorrin-6A/cobalt-precorrin-6A reductase, partial [Alphaproteobacteria bacterium]|nr:precorrin-6A/cobalt-precorrin-6A reductase [Alphaproteobacteria bacterium]